MHPFAIMVITFRNDELLHHHVQKLKESNPGVPVEVFSSDVIIPGAGHISQCGSFASRWKAVHGRRPAWRSEWGNSDLLIYGWWLHARRVEAERWLILEYDTLCEVNLQELYAPAWDADIVCANYIMPPTRWSAFLTNRLMPDDLRPCSAGILPMTGLLFKPSALDQLSILAAIKTDADVISEYRIGTFAKSLGLDVRELPGLKDMVSCHEVTPTHAGLWHPVKTTVCRHDSADELRQRLPL